MNWDDMPDEMLSQLVFDLPRLIGPWERRLTTKRPTWVASEVPTHACDFAPTAHLRVTGRWDENIGEFVYRWQVSIDPDVFDAEGYETGRLRAMSEAEGVMRRRGFRFLPPVPAIESTELKKGDP